MGSTIKLLFLIAFLSLAMPIMTKAHPLNTKFNLITRLKLIDGETSNCWDSLFQLQACTGEVIMFFLNGETILGPKCCEAIRIIQHECWPALLGSLGFTSEEGDVLESYCDAALNSPPSSPQPLTPPSPVKPNKNMGPVNMVP